MVATTLNGVMLTGNHASRPAATAVAKGALYACSTHSLIYQSDASSWSTWATLTGTGLTDPMTTRGDIIIRDSSNTSARLGRGSADTYLGSDGTDISYSAVTDAKLSTSDITTNNASTTKHGFLKKLDNDSTHFMDGTGAWSTPAGAGGGLSAILETHTASSSATLDFTTFLSSTYDAYLFEFQGILPATNAVELYLRMGTGAGPTFDSGANYSWNEWRWIAGGSAAGGAGSTNQIALVSPTDHQANTSSWGLNGWMILYVTNDGTRYPRILADMGYLTSGASDEGRLGRGQYASTTTITGVRFLMSSGNISSGTIRVKGLTK